MSSPLDIVNALPTQAAYQAQYDTDIANFVSQEYCDRRACAEIARVVNLTTWPDLYRPSAVETRERMSQTVVDILTAKGYTVTSTGVMGHRVSW
jgi:hypothetical protein